MTRTPARRELSRQHVPRLGSAHQQHAVPAVEPGRERLDQPLGAVLAGTTSGSRPIRRSASAVSGPIAATGARRGSARPGRRAEPLAERRHAVDAGEDEPAEGPSAGSPRRAAPVLRRVDADRRERDHLGAVASRSAASRAAWRADASRESAARGAAASPATPRRIGATPGTTSKPTPQASSVRPRPGTPRRRPDQPDHAAPGRRMGAQERGTARAGARAVVGHPHALGAVGGAVEHRRRRPPRRRRRPGPRSACWPRTARRPGSPGPAPTKLTARAHATCPVRMISAAPAARSRSARRRPRASGASGSPTRRPGGRAHRRAWRRTRRA